MSLVASADAGPCDVSPKGGPPGFVRVLDDHRLLIPDATGNRRLDGLQNILENPHVGLLFLVPGMGETLRVNGRVRLTRDPNCSTASRPAAAPRRLALVVSVIEVAYIHCAKALLRSAPVEAGCWLAPSELPTAAEILG